MWNWSQEERDAFECRLWDVRRPAIHHRPDEAVTAACRREATTLYGEGPAADEAAHEMEVFAHARGLLQRHPPLRLTQHCPVCLGKGRTEADGSVFVDPSGNRMPSFSSIVCDRCRGSGRVREVHDGSGYFSDPSRARDAKAPLRDGHGGSGAA